MDELDMAMIVIFLLGVFGVHVEPWSPHPPVMVGVGLLYFMARIAVPIVVSKIKFLWRYRNGQKRSSNKDSHGNRIYRSWDRRSGRGGRDPREHREGKEASGGVLGGRNS